MASGKKTVFIILIVVGFLFFAVSMMAVIFSGWEGGNTPELSYGRSVALVTVDGTLTSSDEYVRQLRKYRDNSSVKAVVIRVNSPGGGVSAAQEVYQAIKRTRTKKPVVCSMADVAASGGYYIACACDSIVANPGTLTGSIGAILEFPMVQELMTKVGVRFEVVKAGANKDIGSMFRPMTPGERALLQATIDDVHLQFMEAVSESRNIPLDTVRTFADGRVFTGRQARDLQLVDRLGTLEDAVDLAGRLGGIKEKPRLLRERKREPSWFDLISSASEVLSQAGKQGQVRMEYLFGK